MRKEMRLFNEDATGGTLERAQLPALPGYTSGEGARVAS